MKNKFLFLALTVSVIGFVAVSCDDTEPPKSDFDLFIEELNTYSHYQAQNGNTVYYKTNLFITEVDALSNKMTQMATAAGFYLGLQENGTVSLTSIAAEMRPADGYWFLTCSMAPDQKSFTSMAGVRSGQNITVGVRSGVR